MASWVVCGTCKEEVLIPWSCKTRQFCPSCGQRRSHEFAVFLQESVLEKVPWRHVVFTIPKAIRGLFLRERRLLRELSRCAWKTIQRGLQVGLGQPAAVAGAVISVSTAGDLVNPHPHLHCIVADGAWHDGQFRPWPTPVTSERLEALFRRTVLRMLVRQERLSVEAAQRLLSWSPSGFSVFLGDPIADHQPESLERLARYLVKPPVSLERLEYDAATCQVRYTSHKRGEVRTLSALDFLAELSTHVPDHGEQTARYYGFISNRARGSRHKAGQTPVAIPQMPPPDEALARPSRKAFRLAWADLLSKVDALRCPRCGGDRRIIGAITQLAVAHRILTHLGRLHLPRAPDRHDCEDRDPTLQAVHPLFHQKSDAHGSHTVAEPHPPDEWYLDPPHPED
jgi:DNA-directed RNA polymerase subunit RPC12/RpoP